MGSSRLGMWKPAINLATGNAQTPFDTLGRKFFELTNHLGNVLATITDRRLQVANGNNIDHFEADVVNAQDYYAFGMQQPGRTYSANGGNYRYGFNGKENDNEVKGAGDQQDYGMRIYDPRLGRFLSVDPITESYPQLTPYQFASNRPIDGIDFDGKEWLPYRKWTQDYDKAGVCAIFANVTANTVIGAVNAVAGIGIGAKNLSVHAYKVVTGKERPHTFADDIVTGVQVYRKVSDFVNQPTGKIASDVLNTANSPETYGAVIGFFSLGGGEGIFAPLSLVETSADEAFFWSGRTEGMGGELRALEIARMNGGVTLEGLIKERGIEMPAWDASNKEVVKDW